jgi:hypothetical protein
MLRDEIGGAGFAIGQLWMRMDVAPPGHDLALDLRGTAVDFGVEPAGLSVERGDQSKGEGGQEE